MARERFVTRTINEMSISAICMDIKTMETGVKELTLTGDILDNDKALKVCKKMYETEDFKVVAVTEIKVDEVLYGLPEVDFIKVAKKLDPNTRKVVE